MKKILKASVIAFGVLSKGQAHDPFAFAGLF